MRCGRREQSRGQRGFYFFVSLGMACIGVGVGVLRCPGEIDNGWRHNDATQYGDMMIVVLAIEATHETKEALALAYHLS